MLCNFQRKDGITWFSCAGAQVQLGKELSAVANDRIEVLRHTHDYCPPKYITLLFTDLGILTPSAVSDTLIRLYL